MARLHEGGFWVLAIAAPAAAAGLFFTSSQGCTVLTNDEPLPEAGLYDGGEGGADASASCNTCVAEACPGEWSACFASVDCVALLECAQAPGCDDACRAKCACNNPLGVNLYAAALRCDQPQRCGTGPCNAECTTAGETATCSTTAPACGTATDAGSDAGTSASDGGAEGGTADAGPVAPPVTAATCSSCISGTCNDQKQQCPIASDCDLYISCGTGCTTAACVADCGTTFASGKQASSQLAQCVNLSCTPQCGL
jgi:hypothetical protein